MKLVERGPQEWQLLQDGIDYYLSVRCQQSFVEYELLIRLTAEEYREYHALGRVYLAYLAARVSYFAPDYRGRNESSKLRAAAHAAVMEWKAAHPDELL